MDRILKEMTIEPAETRGEGDPCPAKTPSHSATCGKEDERARSRPTLVSSAQTTVHCLSGCIIGESIGLAIGVSFGLGAWTTVILATTLAYLSGFSLAVFPLMRREVLSFKAAMSVVWLGELISIAAMELAMNSVDYWVGGLTATSLAAPIFWIGLGLAALAGFLAAWPVNYFLLARAIKGACH